MIFTLRHKWRGINPKRLNFPAASGRGIFWALVIKQVDKRVKKATETVEKQLFHFQARRFACADDALADLQIVTKKWKYHSVKSYEIFEHQAFEGKGRPKKDQVPTKIEYQVIAEMEADIQKMEVFQLCGYFKNQIVTIFLCGFQRIFFAKIDQSLCVRN